MFCFILLILTIIVEIVTIIVKIVTIIVTIMTIIVTINRDSIVRLIVTIMDNRSLANN